MSKSFQWECGQTSLEIESSVQTHLKSTFADAVNLLKTTGRNVSSTDEQYLRLLLTHSCGWSATYPEHMNDSWVTEFFEARYPQLKGLVPILDSMTYEEELVHFPDEYHFKFPRFFLLATSNCFYFFDATDGEDGLRIAGETLEEVYEGVRDWRWADVSDDPWDFVDEEIYIPPMEYFRTYYRKENGNFGKYGTQSRNVEIPGKVRPGLVQRLCDFILGRAKHR